MKRHARILALALAVVLALALSQTAALADDPPTDIIEYLSSLNADGVTYFNITDKSVNSKKLLASNSTNEFLTRVANSKMPGNSSQSLMDMWKSVARGAYYYKYQKCKYSNPVSPRHALQMYEQGTGSDSIGHLIRVNTEPSYEQSLESAYEQIKTDILTLYKNNGGRRNVSTVPDRGVSSSLDDKIDDIETNGSGVIYALYRNVVGKDHGTVGQRGRYGLTAVIMHNFKLNPLLPEELASKELSWNDSTAPGNPVIFTNETGVPSNISSDLESTTTETISNTYSTSEQHEYGQSLDVSYTYGNSSSLHSISVSAGLSFKQTLTEGYTQGKEISKTVKNGSGVSLTIPAHTKVVAQSSVRTEALQYSYDCPVSITYDVLVLRFDLNMTDAEAYGAGGDPTSDILLRIGTTNDPENEDARMDFVDRFFENGSDRDGFKGKWYDIYELSSGLNIMNIAYEMKRYAPLSITGGVITNQALTTSYTVGEIEALYPLREIKPDVTSINLRDGEQLDLASIQLTPYNGQTIQSEYYGFSEDYGAWKLYTTDSSQLSDDTPYAKIETDSETKAATLISKNVNGTAYLKYVIDETKYPDALSDTGFTKNSQLTSPAVIKVSVTTEPFTGTVAVAGTVSGRQGAWPRPKLPQVSGQTVDGQTLKATVKDASGAEIEVPITEWISSDNTIAEVNGFEIILKKQGTCTLSAKYKDVTSSAGATVTVNAPRKITSLALEMPARFNDSMIIKDCLRDGDNYYLWTKNTNDASNKFIFANDSSYNRYYTAIGITAYDQDGVKWTDRSFSSSLQWYCDGELAAPQTWSGSPLRPNDDDERYGNYYSISLAPAREITIKAVYQEAEGELKFSTRNPQEPTSIMLSDDNGILNNLILANSDCMINMGQLKFTPLDQYGFKMQKFGISNTTWSVTPAADVDNLGAGFVKIKQYGDYQVTATITDAGGITKTTQPLSFSVRDGSNIVAGISIKNNPEGKYYHGDYFDPSGLAVDYYYYRGTNTSTVKYSDTTKSQFSFVPSLTTPLTPGDKYVTISYGGQSVEYDINVSTLTVETVHIDPVSAEIKVGETKQLTSSVLPAKATVKNVTWKSLDPAVATVSSTGLVTGVSHGDATITAASTDGGNAVGMCMVSVNGLGNNAMTLSIAPAVSQPIPEDTVEFKVNIANNPGIAACNLTIGFDKDVLEIAIDSSGKPIVSAGGAASGFTVMTNTSQAAQGKIGITMIFLQDVSANGAILKFSLKLKEDAEFGSYPLSIQSDSFISNAAGDKIPYVRKNSLVTLRAILKGDVDMDTLIQLSDAREVLMYLSGEKTLSAKAMLAADVNNDGSVTMDDALRIMRHVAKIEIIN